MAHREWTENHIRELVRAQLKKVKGGGDLPAGFIAWSGGPTFGVGGGQVGISRIDFLRPVSTYEETVNGETKTYQIMEFFEREISPNNYVMINNQRVIAAVSLGFDNAIIPANNGSMYADTQSTYTYPIITESGVKDGRPYVFQKGDGTEENPDKKFRLGYLDYTYTLGNISGLVNQNGQSVSIERNAFTIRFYVAVDVEGYSPWSEYDWTKTDEEYFNGDYPVRIIRYDVLKEQSNLQAQYN